MPTNFLIGFNGDPSAGATPPQATSQTFNKASYGVISGNTLTPIHLVAAGDHLTLITARGRTDTLGVPAAAVLGVYVTDAAGTAHGAKVAGNYTTATTLVNTGTAATVSTAPIDFDLTPWAGQYIKLSYGHDTLWRRAVHNSVSDSSVTSTGDLADPFGTPSNNIYIPAMWMTITRPDANSIDSVNDDDEIDAGVANTAEVTGYVVGVNPIVSGTIGSLVLTDVSQTDTTVDFTVPDPVNDSYYPEPDTSQTLTLTDGADPAVFNGPFNFLTGYTSVVLSSPDNLDPYKLGYYATVAPVTGDRIAAEFVVSSDTGFEDVTAGTYVWYHWVSATSKIYSYEATVVGVAPVMPGDTLTTVLIGATSLGTYPADSGSTPITYTLAGAQAGLFTINSITAQVDSIAPLSEGVGSIVVTATNGTGTDNMLVSYEVVAAPEPTVVLVDTVYIGSSTAITVSNFSGPITSGTIDGIALESVSDTAIQTFIVVDGQNVPRPGTRSLSVTDGTDGDTIDVTVAAPAGWSSYTITADFVQAINGVATVYLPVGWALGDFVFSPNTPAVGKTTSVSDSGVTTNNVGVQELFLVDSVTGLATAFTVTTTTGADEVGSGSAYHGRFLKGSYV